MLWELISEGVFVYDSCTLTPGDEKILYKSGVTTQTWLPLALIKNGSAAFNETAMHPTKLVASDSRIVTDGIANDNKTTPN